MAVWEEDEGGLRMSIAAMDDTSPAAAAATAVSPPAVAGIAVAAAVEVGRDAPPLVSLQPTEAEADRGLGRETERDRGPAARG